MAAAEPTSATGRALGRRGTETRQRILDTIAAMIETHGVRELRLSEVTREVGVSPPAFYQYFKDLDEALLALCEQVGEHTTGVRTALATDWSAGDGTELARRFVEDFTAYWDDNRPVLWMRNVAAQDGDDRFREIRNRSLDPIATGVTHQIEVGQSEGRVDPTIAPQALATALMMLVERMGMMYPGVEWRGVTRDEMVRAVTYIFERTVVGVPPSSG